MSAKGRPRRMEGETRTYNVLFPISLLARIHEESKTLEISSPQLIREVLEKYFEAVTTPYNTANGGYKQGVLDSCIKIRQARQLKGRLPSGSTLGETLAETIEKELTATR